MKVCSNQCGESPPPKSSTDIITTACCRLQHFSHPGAVDVLRAVRLGAYGFFIDGPVGSMWYDILEKYVYPQEQTSTKAVLAKTALDQVVYATIMTGGGAVLHYACNSAQCTSSGCEWKMCRSCLCR